MPLEDADGTLVSPVLPPSDGGKHRPRLMIPLAGCDIGSTISLPNGRAETCALRQPWEVAMERPLSGLTQPVFSGYRFYTPRI